MEPEPGPRKRNDDFCRLRGGASASAGRDHAPPRQPDAGETAEGIDIAALEAFLRSVKAASPTSAGCKVSEPGTYTARNRRRSAMNAVEIEEAISTLAEMPFDATEFPFAFL